MLDEKVVLGASDHVDDRVADAENIVAGACHEYLLSKCLQLRCGVHYSGQAARGNLWSIKTLSDEWAAAQVESLRRP
jgi:hypothetical protein